MPELDLNFLVTPGALWWLGLLLALLVGCWAYYRLAAPLGSGLRYTLQVARIVALLILLAALLEPILSVRGESTGRPRLAVLVDRSSSMRLPGKTAPTRREEAAQLLGRLEDALAPEFDLDVAGFAGSVVSRQDADSTYPWQPLGVTAMGEALEEVLLHQAESPVGGVIILTDGVHTSGKDPALVARNLPVPVFAAVVGDTTAPPDLMIRQVRSQTLGHVGEPLAVRAVLEAAGHGGEAVEVTVREVGQGSEKTLPSGPVLARRRVEIPAAGSEIEAALEVRPIHAGLTLFEVAASLAPEAGVAAGETELVALNNSRLFAVDVREKKTRVLYIEHEPDWDFSFLKRTLDADTSLAYSYLVRQVDGSLVRYGAPGPERLPRSPADLAPYAAVILGRVVPSQLPSETVAALKAFLLDGGGLLLLGAAGEGDLAHWQSAWGGLIPVSVRAERRHGYTASVVDVTLEGLTHEITAISDSPVETEAEWNRLPPVWIREGAYRVARGARVLLTARTGHSPREVPLLALGRAGAGRLAIVTARGFWRWDFAMQAVREEAPAARELWRRMMRYLAEPVQRERFKISPTRNVFQDSEAPSFVARLYDESYQPISGARVNMVIEPLRSLAVTSGEEGVADAPASGLPEAGRAGPLQLALYPDGSAGRYAGKAAALPPGAYRYRATARLAGPSGRRGQTDEGLFWVEPMGPEYFDLAASERLPRLLASSSGGLLAGSAEIPALVEAVPERYKRLRVVRQAELWKHWGLLVSLVVVLSLEWILRRRKGLA